MADSNDASSSSPPSRRRSSFAGQTFADLFGTGRTRSTVGSENTANASTTQGSITSAAAQAQRRRMSINTLGISGGQGQGTTFGGSYIRRDSISSANSGSIDESAIEDDVGPSQATPATPFARRMSFGAKALRDVKVNTNGGGGGSPGSSGDKTNGRSSVAEPPVSGGSEGAKKTARVDAAPTSTKSRGDGYNWADNFRNRAERSSSIASVGGSPMAGTHVRAKSMATMQPPAQEMPKANVPDHFQERILKGDFYMD